MVFLLESSIVSTEGGFGGNSPGGSRFVLKVENAIVRRFIPWQLFLATSWHVWWSCGGRTIPPPRNGALAGQLGSLCPAAMLRYSSQTEAL